MNINNFWKDLQKLELSPSENEECIKQYFRKSMGEGQIITLFSWKLFNIKIKRQKLEFDFTFDVQNADKYIAQEVCFLKLLRTYGIKFRYVKLIPDELPFYFWQELPSNKYQQFADSVSRYFKKIEQKTEVIRISKLLKDSTEWATFYKKVFERVDNSFNRRGESSLVNQLEFDKEILNRSTYYSPRPLPQKQAKRLAKKAFSLFAAETALLFKLQTQGVFPNMIMLAGKRSANTYKYEFFRDPKNRPILPKLFVI